MTSVRWQGHNRGCHNKVILGGLHPKGIENVHMSCSRRAHPKGMIPIPIRNLKGSRMINPLGILYLGDVKLPFREPKAQMRSRHKVS